MYLAALLLALGSSAPPAFAQAVYGSVAGTILDTSGAALPGVTVTITSVDRKTVDTVVTNEAGPVARIVCCRAATRSPPRSQGSNARSFPTFKSASTRRPLSTSSSRSARSARPSRCRGSHPSSRPTALTSPQASTRNRSPNCRSWIATSPSSSCSPRARSNSNGTTPRARTRRVRRRRW